jgi:proteasome accessory factor C
MSGARSPKSAESRLSRLLVILPWLMERGAASVAETAARFDVSENDLVRDLELVAMCGLPPYVDELIDLFIDDGTIIVGVPRLFLRPLRLTEEQAFELLAAGRAAMQLPGADPEGALNRGLRKLAIGLGEDDTGVLVISPNPAEVTQLVDAAREGREVAVVYRSRTREEATERVLTPFRTFQDFGRWYVTAHDSLSDEVRDFRVDRIESLEIGGPSARRPPDDLGAPGTWFVDADIERVDLRIGPAGRWVVERYPVDSVTEPDTEGWVSVRMAVTGESWLARLLLRLGDQVEVIGPDSMRGIGRDAALRVLERYDVG